MHFRHFITLRTDLDADDCIRRLSDSIDPERLTIFSLSGYSGSKPVIGRIMGYEFYLHKRRNWRNDFAPQFHGNLRAQDRGTLIEGYFDAPRWTRIFMRVWLGAAVLLAGPVFLLSLWDLFTGGHYVKGDLRVGLLVPPCMILFGILLPRLGLWLGRYEEQFIVEFLERTFFAARSMNA